MCVCEINTRHQQTFAGVQETSDHRRPLTVVLETGLQDLDQGPVLDPDQPSVLKAEVRSGRRGYANLCLDLCLLLMELAC